MLLILDGFFFVEFLQRYTQEEEAFWKFFMKQDTSMFFFLGSWKKKKKNSPYPYWIHTRKRGFLEVFLNETPIYSHHYNQNDKNYIKQLKKKKK